MNKTELLKAIDSHLARSAWDKAVNLYAYELIDDAEQEEFEVAPELENTLLNGARDWSDYSYGGCALIHNYDLAERLCAPSELAKKDGGRLQPNSRETWLDVQARALFQAFQLIKRIVRRNDRKAMEVA